MVGLAGAPNAAARLTGISATLGAVDRAYGETAEPFHVARSEENVTSAA